jgi:hypothetical protein
LIGMPELASDQPYCEVNFIQAWQLELEGLCGPWHSFSVLLLVI